MWWIWLLVVVAVIAALFLVLRRRGSTGDPSYRPDDPRSGSGLGGPPGQWGPGDGGGAG